MTNLHKQKTSAKHRNSSGETVPVSVTQSELIVRLCRAIEQSSETMHLKDLARLANMSNSHLHRLFKAVTGLTPKAYASADRANKVRQALASKRGTITETFYNAGFHASSRFYDASEKMLGMSPSRYRAGGINETIHFAVGTCSLGEILVASSQRGLCAIALGDNPQSLLDELQNRFPRAQLIGADATYERVVAQVIAYVESPQIGLDLPLDIRGTAFQQRVWQVLQCIPIGQTLNYTQVAQRIQSPRSVRAVAQACAANALAVVIPCHRVIRSDGGLSGYRWGVERKRALLESEAAASPQKSI